MELSQAHLVGVYDLLWKICLQGGAAFDKVQIRLEGEQ